MVWILAKVLFVGFGVGFGLFFAIFMVIAITDDPHRNKRLRQEGYDMAIYEITHMGRFYDREEKKMTFVKVTRMEEKDGNPDGV